jgi:hypothetical protein
MTNPESYGGLTRAQDTAPASERTRKSAPSPLTVRPTTAWCVSDCTGRLLTYALGRTRKDAIDRMYQASGYQWPVLRSARYGFTVHRVTITPEVP